MHLIRIYIIIIYIIILYSDQGNVFNGLQKVFKFVANLGEANSTSSETGCTLLTTKAELAILFHDGCAREKKFMRKKMSSFFQVC